jgi:type I restriction enzyme S subunit
MVNGNLPEGWRWTTVGDITLPIKKVFPQEKPDQRFTYLDISSIDNKVHQIIAPKKYLGAEAPSRARQLVQANDILFSTVRTYLENIALVPEAYDGQIASTGFAVLRASEAIVPKLLFYYSLTNAFLEPLNELQRGTSYPAVRDVDVRVQPFPLPPLPEQERIVAKIEALFTQLDAGVAALKRVKAALKRYKASLLKAACEGRLVPYDKYNQPVSDLLEKVIGKNYTEKIAPQGKYNIPSIPLGWAYGKLENLIYIAGRIGWRGLKADEYTDEGPLFLSVYNLTQVATLPRN